MGLYDGQAKGKPAASTVSGANRLDVWVRGLDDGLWHAYRIKPQDWSEWIPEGAPDGGLQSPPTVFTRNASPLTIDVVARGTGDSTHGYKTWARAWLNGWYPWADIGFQGLGTPSIAVDSSHTIEVVGRGFGLDDVVMFAKHWTPALGWYDDDMWTSRLPYSGFTGSPVAIYDAGTYNDFYVLGSGHVWRHR